MGIEKNKKDSPHNIEDALFRGKYNTMTLAEILLEADSLDKNVVIYFTGWNHTQQRTDRFNQRFRSESASDDLSLKDNNWKKIAA
ncbi:hypothetical protein [Sphingobacterium prati]|uniref:hypothetical protein n=1 Tax=Sphingobacterium prati TaxID=2737006 RepID=UPI001553A70E|nr:hypothetical protein [Sphingobacterium prati]NPE45778.1 hypothetical protein [Sphingobacterium prati]